MEIDEENFTVLVDGKVLTFKTEGEMILYIKNRMKECIKSWELYNLSRDMNNESTK